MRYRLINNSQNDIYDVQKTVFLNRGIDNYKEYINLTDDVLIDYNKLDNIQTAIECLLKHIEKNSNIHIIVDSDCDGYTSASIIYKYIRLLKPDANLTYSIHKGKQHGLSDDIEIPENTNLIIVPDAGSNDVEQCQELKDRGIDIIILDHHICDKENQYAIIINNQNCDYDNKALSGVGIVYKFLQALDNETWNDYAENFIDLVALGNIADNMNLLEYETKRLVDKGLNKIRNKFLKALMDKQSFSMNNLVNIINVQFYIVPLINGMIRSGDSDEKDMMFRAFIETDEVFKYKKRGETEETDEDIYTRTARLCGNAKGRQNNSKDKSLIKINEEIKKRGYDKNKIIFCNVTDILNETMTGVVAMKVAEQYKRPCLLLRKTKSENKDEVIYGGSGRNIDNSPVDSLKDLLSGLDVFEFVQGHDNAFGCEIKKDNIQKAIELINESLKDVDFSEQYEVDFVADYDNIDIVFIKSINDLKDYYATGFKEPYIVIENVNISKSQIELIGKDNNTFRFMDDNKGITFIKFKLDESNDSTLIEWIRDEQSESINLTIVGKCGLNTFKGILIPQVIICDYNINGD